MAEQQPSAAVFRGGGRGQLMQRLLTDSSSNLQSVDSGNETGSLPQSLGRGSGRGTLSSKLSTSESNDRAAERARLINTLRSLQSASAKSETDDVESEKSSTSGIMTGTSSPKDSSSASEIADKVKTISIDEPEVEMLPCRKVGVKGTPINIHSNYIRLNIDKNKGIFEYEVKFEPNVHSKSLRFRVLNQHVNVIGNAKTFDGTTLYLPFRLDNPNTELKSLNENDNTTVTVKIIFKRQKRMAECVQFYNILFGRIMNVLKFVRIGQNYFDPQAPKIIPQHKLEVWPGYVTAVDEYEDGVMLCLDISHRVLNEKTVLDLMNEAYRSDNINYQRTIQSALLGAVVLTRYNNSFYRIDDINFEASPMDTFQWNNQEINFLQYYKNQYNIDIQNTKQPLLIHNMELKIAGKVEKQYRTICLVPEICYLTGYTDEMRSDFKVMRDIATYTKVSPNQRLHGLNKFCNNLKNTPKALEYLTNWGISLDPKTVELQGRNLGIENIIFARKTVSAGENADFNRVATSNELLEVINLTNWLVIYTTRDAKCARSFVEIMERNSAPMGIRVNKPILEKIDVDKTDLYVQKLRKCINQELQIVVIICPTSRDDRYAAIKKVCCSELPMPSQVINARTLSNDAKNRSIVQKIALQMNCKMGGTLWSVNIPFKNVMVCGIDTYHDSNKKQNSVSAFVASLNRTYTRWYSKAIIQKQKEEFVNGLCVSLMSALNAYKLMNKALPEKIIIFRDGVGDGQLKMCNEYEVPQLKNACRYENPDYNPDFTFIVVQKRINTRLFSQSNNGIVNPLPGSIVDHTITRRFLYDFFLVSQNVREGTVTPTHYIVAYDSANFEPDILQRLSYKLCFLYYNWPGTVRVPACCQYAHKLAFLVGQSVKRPTAEVLADKLFYL